MPAISTYPTTATPATADLTVTVQSGTTLKTTPAAVIALANVAFATGVIGMVPPPPAGAAGLGRVLSATGLWVSI